MSEAAALDPLLEEFYPVWLRFHPDVTLVAEEASPAVRPAALNDDDAGALMSLLESLLVELEEVDFQGLDADRRLDLRLVFGAAQIEHCELLTRDWRHRDPLRFLPLRELHELTLRRPAGLAERLEQLVDRIPAYLRYARTQLSAMPELINRISLAAALEEAEAGIPFLRGLAAGALVQKLCRDPARIQEACDRAAQAVVSYSDFLSRDLAPAASGGLGVGEDHYRRLLRQRHFLSLGLGEIRRTLEALVGSLQEQARARAAELVGEPDLLRLAGALEAVYPLAGPERIEQCERDCERLRRIADDLDWLTPPEAGLRVTEKPTCLRPGLGEISYVAPSAPENFGAGRLFLPPLAQGEKESRLQVLDRALEAGPLGLHLLELCSRREAEQRRPRRFNRSAGLRGGWVFYLRGLIAGVRDQLSVEEGAALLLANLRLAQYALLDLDMHSQGLAYEAAAERLRRVPGLPERRVDTELTHLSRHPADAIAAVIGGRLIGHARDIVVREGRGLPLRSFHDRILRQGMIAPPLIIQRQFGEAVWKQALERLGW